MHDWHTYIHNTSCSVWLWVELLWLVDALKKESMTASKDTSQNIKNVYNIGGDIVYGDKKTII